MEVSCRKKLAARARLPALPRSSRALTARRVRSLRGIDWVRTFRLILLAALTLYAITFTVRVYVRKYFVFLPDYARWTMFGTAPLLKTRPTHVFLLMADHFEPNSDPRRVADWTSRYRALAARHRDSNGRPPQHTWFYPGEQRSKKIMRILQRMTASGLGEVELHYHHQNDTADSLRRQIQTAIGEFGKFGFLETVDGKTAFGFIHGNAGLDNSKGSSACGVDTEIALLQQLGAFADFTFPSIFESSQPHRVNTIYAARDDSGPKSYDRILPLTSLRDGEGQLMIFQGPLIFGPSLSIRRLFLDLDDGDIHATDHASPARADRWIRANVHVPRRDDWVFVKLFAHGASTPGDIDSVVGADYDDMLGYLERTYNDGTRYVLHYITAREAYNLARAAAEGADGAPEQYLNAYIRPYRAAFTPTPFERR
jgi:hypothetical protein